MRTREHSMNKMNKITIVILCLLFGVGFSYSQEFKNSSVLKSGTWYKIKVAETGVYQLSYDDLKQIGIETPQNVAHRKR